MLWFEILGWIVGYLLLGIPAVRLMYMITEEDDFVKDMSGFCLALWPAALVIFGLVWFSKLAFKWGPK